MGRQCSNLTTQYRVRPYRMHWMQRETKSHSTSSAHWTNDKERGCLLIGQRVHQHLLHAKLQVPNSQRYGMVVQRWPQLERVQFIWHQGYSKWKRFSWATWFHIIQRWFSQGLRTLGWRVSRILARIHSRAHGEKHFLVLLPIWWYKDLLVQCNHVWGKGQSLLSIGWSCRPHRWNDFPRDFCFCFHFLFQKVQAMHLKQVWKQRDFRS